jgi:hypothetical protein
VALLAGLAKATEAVEWAQSGGLDPALFAMATLILVLLTTPVALLFIVTLMTGPKLATRLLTVVLVGIVATLVIALVMQIQWGGFFQLSLLQIGALMTGAGAAVGISAAALRWAGYRVGRKQGNPEFGAGGSLEETT